MTRRATAPFATATRPDPTMADMPMVVEQTPKGTLGYDLVSRLMKDSIIMVRGGIEAEMASIIVAQLLYLGNERAGGDTPISLYIDSPGGDVNAGMSIYDTMNFVQAEYGVAVSTIGLGMNMSMASLLLCAGTKGYRYLMPNSDHMIHQPSAGSRGTVSDMAIQQFTCDELKQRLALLYAEHTNMTYEEVRKLSDRDSYLRPEECVKRGVVDHVLYPDTVMQRALAAGRNVKYMPGVEEHLKKISGIQRKMNIMHEETRPPNDADPGPYQKLIAESRDNGEPAGKVRGARSKTAPTAAPR